ncbi:MAG: hypothetical protein EA352_03880 [Gemmatimonadales bacterium]|nr:MAG: hypothetical protein EA352_03880 [Gemmatimonadales bacterium]
MDGLFELIFILVFIVAAVLDATARRRKKKRRMDDMESEDKGPSGRPATRGEAPEGASSSSGSPVGAGSGAGSGGSGGGSASRSGSDRETADSMVADDFWAILTGQPREQPSGGDQGEGEVMVRREDGRYVPRSVAEAEGWSYELPEGEGAGASSGTGPGTGGEGRGLAGEGRSTRARAGEARRSEALGEGRGQQGEGRGDGVGAYGGPSAGGYGAGASGDAAADRPADASDRRRMADWDDRGRRGELEPPKDANIPMPLPGDRYSAGADDELARQEAELFGAQAEPWKDMDDISDGEIADGRGGVGDDEDDGPATGPLRRARRGGAGRYTRLLESGSMEDLRKAVVLREVLDQPLSLRAGVEGGRGWKDE